MADLHNDVIMQVGHFCETVMAALLAMYMYGVKMDRSSILRRL